MILTWLAVYGLGQTFQNLSNSVDGLAGVRMLTGKSSLVVAELALALMLLSGAGLMIKSFSRLMATHIGVDPENDLTFVINVPSVRPDRDTATPFFNQLEARIRLLLGVLAAGMNNWQVHHYHVSSEPTERVCEFRCHTDDPSTLLGRASKPRLLLPRFAGVEYRGRGDISRLSPVL